MQSKLYLFTTRFPYSNAENFLEDEIQYLSNNFDVVYVIPYMSTSDRCREMPYNCKLLSPVVISKFDIIKKGLFSKRCFSTLMKDFFENRVFLSWRKFKVWCTAYVATNTFLNSGVIEDVENQLSGGEVLYSYWGKWANVLSLFLKPDIHFISRFHGDWDMWEEKYNNYAPLRAKVTNRLESAVFISQKGRTYFHSKYPTCNTELHRLGTKDIGICQKSSDGILRILSCSAVYPLKRVDLILESVNKAAESQQIEWTHIGGGVDFEKIKEMTSLIKNPNLKINLLGQKTYQEVQEYYKNNAVDLFVNLSTNEGIPVSIMEAISCDVPVVATNVGGTSEIVNERTGILVNSNPSKEEVSQALLKLKNHRSSFTPRLFWEAYYNAEKNYSRFAIYLKSLINN